MTSWAKVRFAVAFVVVGALLAGIWLIPSAASAEKPAVAPSAVPRASSYSDADCQALNELDNEIPDVKSGSNSFYGKQAAAAGEGFSATAKKVEDKKLKSALNTIASTYSQLGKADNVASALAITVKSGKKYLQATANVGKAVASCALSKVTIPSITLPNGVTLPGGVTIPSITLPTIPR